MTKPIVYLRNSDLLREIGKSKASYCSFRDPAADAEYHAIVGHEDEIKPALVAELIDQAAHEKRLVDRRVLTKADLVFRVMSLDHVPLDPDRALRGGHGRDLLFAKMPFQPFRHVRFDNDGELIEVGRSHWKGDFDFGAFDADGGRISEGLAAMLLLLVTRYSARSNWRGYSWIDDMRAEANLHLLLVALSFDEAKSSNPFSYLTTCATNALKRQIKAEKAMLHLRDDLLIEAGYRPSSSRQYDDQVAGVGSWDMWRRSWQDGRRRQ